MEGHDLQPRPSWWSGDRRAELLLGALTVAVLLLVYAILVTIVVRAWPSFSHNGLAWFGSGGSVDRQMEAIFSSANSGGEYVYTFHAWPLIWSTILITGGAVVFSLFFSLLAGGFIVEVAPQPMERGRKPAGGPAGGGAAGVFGLRGV